MTDLMAYLTGFGLASGAGAKACIPVLALGAFHYTPYFELSERFLWIASPPVMVVLGILVLAEIIIDSNPDLGHLSDTVAYLPKMVAGFIAFSAATGSVDDSLIQLSGSGLLGAGTAVSAHWLRNRLRRPFRDLAEQAHEAVGKVASFGEAGIATAAAGAALIAPPVGVALIALVAAGVGLAAILIERRRVPCVVPECGQPIRPGALVCKHCGADQKTIEAPAQAGA